MSMGELRERIENLRSSARIETATGQAVSGMGDAGDLNDLLKFVALETAALWESVLLIADRIDA